MTATSVRRARDTIRCLPLALLLWALFSTPSAGGEQADRVRAAIARTRQICNDVEALRGLRFKRPVPVETQSADGLRDDVIKAIERQFGEEGPEPYVRGLLKLGVLKEPIDFTDTVLRLMEGQAAAHYDPEEDVYYLHATNTIPHVLDLISSHELCHALQDQHFDLYAFMQEDSAAIRDNGDADMARQGLVEGEATAIMIRWMVTQQPGEKTPEMVDMVSTMAVRMQAALDFDAIMKLTEAGVMSGDAGLGSFGPAMEDLKTFPRFFVETLYSAYIQGALMVETVREAGGWDAVTALYDRPPESTEQLLHPAKLGGVRDVPMDVRAAEPTSGLPAGWRLAEEDVLGEMGTRILFALWPPKDGDGGAVPAPAAAAAGWGGDRYYYFEHPDSGADLLVWRTAWDSDAEADEFAAAYEALLVNRFGKLTARDTARGAGGWRATAWDVGGGRLVKMSRRGAWVVLVDTTEPALLDLEWPQAVAAQ